MNLKDWKKNVIEYNESLNKQLQKNDAAKQLYYGFEIIDGKIIQKPDILFVGINPGKGDGETHYEIKFSTEKTSYVHPFDKEYVYPLAEFAIQIIRELGINDDKQIMDYLLTKCVKTNLFHIVTKGDKQIIPALETIKSFKSYWKESVTFITQLIKIIEPKIIIFEGKGVFIDIVENTWGKNVSWDNNTNIAHSFIEDLNVHCIGYKRNNWSGFETDPKMVAEEIKNITKKSQKIDLNQFMGEI